MARRAKLLSGTHRRPSKASHTAEVIRAGDIFEPTEQEARQNAGRLEWLDEEPVGQSPVTQPDEATEASEVEGGDGDPAAEGDRDPVERADEDAAEVAVVEELPDWTLKTGPEEYLDRWPDGPKADLARAHVDNGG